MATLKWHMNKETGDLNLLAPPRPSGFRECPGAVAQLTIEGTAAAVFLGSATRMETGTTNTRHEDDLLSAMAWVENEVDRLNEDYDFHSGKTEAELRGAPIGLRLDVAV